ncbi:flavin-containing monooxygenase [Congregibacter litoralis]|uniref:Putative flavoprotein involved in K+ transport n=1 Tax=Congregibacter litoralis KT71 TaxID=314285 RepID=A4AA17_9GAMM|nr:NAD(P)/FAD-dependent oxidoreductase [Congregibacter litoralis]EAQ97334.1 putative flavoprotein involved in K+ transport [Congregibacter litoralis KT71]
MSEILDVVIIGAGLSGVGAACHLKRSCPERKIAILEGRERSGGTWDLFRYPGIRSDSDMHTLGYSFKPWEASKAIADGPSILSYVRETAREYGLESLIRYRHKVKRANWDSREQCWELIIDDGENGEETHLKTRFLHLCAGYYNYTHGHQPEFPGRDSFAGEFIHPQFWPENLDYEGKRVLIIGSGATAMTLVPSMADKAAEVVMLQRSPTWVVSRPSTDWIANLLRAVLPKSWAYSATRWKNTRMQHWLYKKTRKQPEKVRQMLLDRTRKELGDAGDMADFTPQYNPWDQRLCLVPDSDLFAAIKGGKARVVTNQIETLTPGGVRLADGTEIAADIIVSATGLELELMGGIDLQVDGERFDIPSSWSYRGMMCTGLPNMVSVFGYINASWTLRADIVSQWMCRLLAHMDSTGAAVVTPEIEDELPAMTPRPWIDDFSAGYMQRVMHLFPRQGDRNPWVNSQNYLREKQEFEEMRFDEAALRYEPPRETASEGQRAA